MTAEIAIINRTAVTLAADSAMTLSGGTSDKIYNSADKIFELSSHDPIGIMIYNSLDFMGVPLDVAIKQFRDSSKCKHFVSLETAATAFFDFLKEDINAPQEAQALRVRVQAAILFTHLKRRFDEKFEKIFLQNPKSPPAGFSLHQLFVESINIFLIPFRNRAVSPGFEDVSAESFVETYMAALDRAIADSWEELPLDENDKGMLRELGALLFLRDISTPGHTGVVIAGYAGKDIFPSVLQYELDGIIADKLKHRKSQTFSIDRVDRTAEIIPFAQHDMADRFLFGIDPDVETDISTYLENTLRQTGTSIIGDLPVRRSAKSRLEKKNLTDKLEQAIAFAVKEFRESGLKDIKENNKRLIQEMVSFMPKQELSSFAESLINITSIKRKVSAEQETVGGPIDVAVISRSDGFVWVKRKHYFEAGLNPRFFFRKYGMLVPNGAGS